MDDFTKPAEDLSKEAIEYAELRIDKFKLKTSKDIAVILGRIFGMLAMLLVGMTALTAAAFGLVLIIGEALGSYAGGAFIVAGVFAVIVAVLFIFRKRLFLNTFVRLMVRLFYNKDEEPR
ncbi:MAG: hypothetical protein IAB93_06700 [Bacteroidetes bacterium]|uniref:Phage holin family protein n=1 Tax=Candidatus Merdivivens pullistercoris TaxID=2840873 RepID=A0A9D9I4B8_9BACT|nr:hypothetical protein [Candidatus Merdivivens pullistercoris]